MCEFDDNYICNHNDMEVEPILTVDLTIIICAFHHDNNIANKFDTSP